MKTRILFFILIFSTQLTGCASYYASRSNYSDFIDKWLENNEYTKIESSLEELSKDHPDYKIILAKKNIIKSKKQSFIEGTLHAAKLHQSNEQWQMALDAYDAALLKIANDPAILNDKKNLLSERDTQVKELRKNMLLRRARALIQYKPIYNKLNKLIPNDHDAQYDIRKFDYEISETSSHLIDCSNYALNEKNYTLAEECLELSNELVPSKITVDLISKTKNIIKRDSDEKTVHLLIKAYRDAYDSGNFPKARLHLDQLLVINPTHIDSLLLKEQLDRDINTRIEKGINLGKVQYSQGKINSALKTWQDLSKLDPKNEELSALIIRAQKVSSKIERLEKSPVN